MVSGSGWWPVIRESFAGAWQKNVVLDHSTISSFHAVWACGTLIASDISKLQPSVEELKDGVWQDAPSSPFNRVLNKPNGFQNRIQFIEKWILSKVFRGNTYVLKGRDGSGRVDRFWILDPMRVRPMVSDDGAVFYELSSDNLSGIGEQVTVPAREIIHDRWNCLFHDLVGLSPIYACGYAATQGMQIQKHGIKFFANGAQPSGILTAPGRIGPETATRLKEHFESKFTGENIGRIAVLGDGLKFEKMVMSAVDTQMIEQLKLSAEIVCSTFHVPGYKVGVGPTPTYNNIQSLNVEYYSQCLQVLIEAFELCVGEGIDLPSKNRINVDLDNLLRMDTVTLMETLKAGVQGGIYAPNEARRRVNLPPKQGGDSPYLQQQNFSLEALAKRDAKEDPFARAPGQGGGSIGNDPNNPNPDDPNADPSQQAPPQKLMISFDRKGSGKRKKKTVSDWKEFRLDTNLGLIAGFKALRRERPVASVIAD